MTPPRAEVVTEIERRLLELYRDPALTEKPALLEQRGGAFYSEAAIQLVASLVADSGDVQVVDIRNDGDAAGARRRRRGRGPGAGRPRRRGADGAAAARARAARPGPARRGVRAAGRGGRGQRRPRRRAAGVDGEPAGARVRAGGEHARRAARASERPSRRAASGDARRAATWQRRSRAGGRRGRRQDRPRAARLERGAAVARPRRPSQAHYLGRRGLLEVLESLLDEAIARRRSRAVERPFAATAQVLLAGVGPAGGARRSCRGDGAAAMERAARRRQRHGGAAPCGHRPRVGNRGRVRHRDQLPRARLRTVARPGSSSFGPVSGDWGGGGDIGLAALAAAVRAPTDAGRKRCWRPRCRQYFGLRGAARRGAGIPSRELPTAGSAELAPVVLAVCRRGCRRRGHRRPPRGRSGRVRAGGAGATRI